MLDEHRPETRDRIIVQQLLNLRLRQVPGPADDCGYISEARQRMLKGFSVAHVLHISRACALDLRLTKAACPTIASNEGGTG